MVSLLEVLGLLGPFHLTEIKLSLLVVVVLLFPMHTELGIKAKYLTTTAKRPHPFEYFHDELGYNFRMPNVNAALLLAQLEKLEDYRVSKSLVHGKYQSFFDTNIEGAELMSIPETTSQWNYWLMSVQLENREARDEFLEQNQ